MPSAIVVLGMSIAGKEVAVGVVIVALIVVAAYWFFVRRHR